MYHLKPVVGIIPLLLLSLSRASVPTTTPTLGEGVLSSRQLDETTLSSVSSETTIKFNSSPETEFVPKLGEDINSDPKSENEPSPEERDNDSPSNIIARTGRIAADKVRPLFAPFNDYGDQEKAEESLVTEVPHVNDSIKIIEHWSKLTGDAIETIIRETLPIFLRFSYEIELSSECSASLLQLVNGLRKQSAWAFRLLDSFGRISPGFLDGTVTNYGEFDECLEINFPGEGEGEDVTHVPDPDYPDSPPVVGKYCLLRANFPMPAKPKKFIFTKSIINLTGTHLENTVWDHQSKYFNSIYTVKGFRFGICIPSSCTAQEIQGAVNKIIMPIFKTPIVVGPDDECTSRADVVRLNSYQKFAVAVFATMLTLAFIGTATELVYMWLSPRNEYDVNSKPRHRPQNMVASLVSGFSLIKNTRSLFHIREDRDCTLSAIHGMRVLSMFWIIVGHTYCFGGFYKILYTFKRLSVDIIKNPGRLEYQPLINTFLLVDSFFFLGGLVLVYVALPMLEKQKGRFNYLVYVVHRWARLTPALLGIICFLFLMPLLGSGPIYKHEMLWQERGCEKNWWMNVLYINNWVLPVDEMCGGQTWFIAADFQIYLFAPIIFFSYYKSASLGILVNVTLLLAGMAASGVSAYVNDAHFTFGLDHLADLGLLHEYSQYGYFPTYHHVAPYCLGTLVGYFILKYKCKRSLSMPVRSVLWLLMPLASVFVMFCTYNYNDAFNKIEPSTATIVTFSALQRTVWCLGIAWVSFVCATGSGGMVNDILSWRPFIPLSRISYCIYLVHLLPIFMRSNSLRYTRIWDDYAFVTWAISNIFLGVIFAYILYIFFEAPLNNIEKAFFRPKHVQVKDTTNNEMGNTNNNNNNNNNNTMNNMNIVSLANIEKNSAMETIAASEEMSPSKADSESGSSSSGVGSSATTEDNDRDKDRDPHTVHVDPDTASTSQQSREGSLSPKLKCLSS